MAALSGGARVGDPARPGRHDNVVDAHLGIDRRDFETVLPLTRRYAETAVGTSEKHPLGATVGWDQPKEPSTRLVDAAFDALSPER